MAGSQLYTRKVMSRSGNILFFPEVASMSELLDGSASLNPYAESVTQEFPLGTKLVRAERIWRYHLNGAGTPAAGTIMQQAATAHADACIDIVVDTTCAIGGYSVGLTSTANIACAANYYKEGYLVVNVGAACLGNCQKIKSHAALVGTTAGSTFNFYDPSPLAITAGTGKCGLRKNVWDANIATAAVLTGVIAGVATLTRTAAYYGWLATGGPAAVLTNAALATGKGVIAGTTAGKADPSVDNEATLQRIGWAMMTADTQNECALVYLTID